MRARSFIRAAALAGVLTVSTAGSAAAQSASDRVFGDYVSDGRLDPCSHTSDTLKAAQRAVTPDIEQYAPDYPNAIAAALEARARGDCADKKPVLPGVDTPLPAAPAPVATPIPTPVPTAIPTKTVVPAPPAPIVATPASTPAATAAAPAPEDVRLERVSAAAPANDAPAPVLMLGILAAVLATAALFLASMRRLGWADERMDDTRHAWREASWRVEGLWSDFRDWLKLGR